MPSSLSLSHPLYPFSIYPPHCPAFSWYQVPTLNELPEKQSRDAALRVHENQMITAHLSGGREYLLNDLAWRPQSHKVRLVNHARQCTLDDQPWEGRLGLGLTGRNEPVRNFACVSNPWLGGVFDIKPRSGGKWANIGYFGEEVNASAGSRTGRGGIYLMLTPER